MSEILRNPWSPDNTRRMQQKSVQDGREFAILFPITDVDPFEELEKMGCDVTLFGRDPRSGVVAVSVGKSPEETLGSMTRQFATLLGGLE